MGTRWWSSPPRGLRRHSDAGDGYGTAPRVLVEELVGRGHEVFPDLKLFEIPHSVAGAVRAAGALGASMVTVHAMGGTGIMAAAVDAAREFPGPRALIVTRGVTLAGGSAGEHGSRAGTAQAAFAAGASHAVVGRAVTRAAHSCG
ncbi:orotidine 5'-phosphate decarboxylase / HUMPS family protein [Streptomyces sp. NPDC059355]|uniref:orotidine 5'-phosphate decarboxylase / HUMPS family protein n=1 Tax=Streptomyces sp. NPDC059355 TaxID=3346811 RepID=UPI0036BB407B